MDWWQQQLLSSILKLFSFFYASKHSFFPLYRISHSCSWISGTVLTVYMNVYVLMFRRTFSWIFCSMFFFLFFFLTLRTISVRNKYKNFQIFFDELSKLIHVDWNNLFVFVCRCIHHCWSVVCICEWRNLKKNSHSLVKKEWTKAEKCVFFWFKIQ